MGEAFIVRKGGVTSETTAAPTITIVTEAPTGVTFTLTNNDDNTALITYEIDGNRDVVSLAAAATSSNITVALAAGTYTLTAFATVVGEVATSATASVTVVLPQYEELFSTTIATAVTEIDITGLSIGKDDGLRLLYTFVGDSTTTAFYRLRANDITSNYNRQGLQGGGSTIEASRAADDFFAQARSDQECQGFVDMKVSNNDRFVSQSQFTFAIGSAGSNLFNINYNNANTSTVTSITSLKIVSNRTNGIAVGSKIALYKVTEAA